MAKFISFYRATYIPDIKEYAYVFEVCHVLPSEKLEHRAVYFKGQNTDETVSRMFDIGKEYYLTVDGNIKKLNRPCGEVV